MKHELVKWLYIGLDIDMVMGLNLGRSTLNFLFAKTSFCMNMKGQIKP